jgi:hypothetical protein
MTPEQTAAEKVRVDKHRRVYSHTHPVSEISKLPSDVRYFAIVQDSMTYDSGYGDRGQPDMSTMQLLNLTWFEDDEALEAWVLKAVEDRKSYRIVRVEPVKTEVKAVFSIQK